MSQFLGFLQEFSLLQESEEKLWSLFIKKAVSNQFQPIAVFDLFFKFLENVVNLGNNFKDIDCFQNSKYFGIVTQSGKVI